MKKEYQSPPETIFNEDSSGEISIKEMIKELFRRKTLIIIYSIVMAALVICVSSYIYLNSPSLKINQLNFSLLFDGINDDNYPDGSEFIDQDITTNPVLQQVYNNNELKLYFDSYSKFKQSISVQRYNPQLAFLNYEYKAKLSSQSLSSAARYDIEQTFYRQTKGIISKPNFQLVMIYGQTNKYSIPDQLTAKVLNDILSVWVNLAKTQQGVTKYNIPIISKNIDIVQIESSGYFNGTDYLRRILIDLENELNMLSKLPNSNTVVLRLENDENYSLRDLFMKLDYIKNYKLNSLLELIRSSAAYSNKRNVEIYIMNRISSLDNKMRSILERKNTYEQMLLENYLSSSKPLMELSEEESKINQQLLFYDKYLQVYKNSTENASISVVKDIKKRQKALINSENNLINLIFNYYGELNRYNLERNASFYKVNSFSSFEMKKLKYKYVVKISAICWVVLVVLLLLIIVGLHYLKHDEVVHKVKQNNAPDIEKDEYPKPLTNTRLRALPEKSESIERRKKLQK